MGRYMAEIGLTPASRSRVMAMSNQEPLDIMTKVEFVTVYEDAEGKRHERPFGDPRPAQAPDQGTNPGGVGAAHLSRWKPLSINDFLDPAVRSKHLRPTSFCVAAVRRRSAPSSPRLASVVPSALLASSALPGGSRW